jgi:pimeloyl-ACP methyl ester carboxylesterase
VTGRRGWVVGAVLLCFSLALGLACKPGEPASSTPAPMVSATASVLAPTAVTATPEAVPTLAPPAPPAWSACGNFECSAISVPLDYARPAGPQIDVALIRQKARQQDRRIGSLLVNPGGPGGSGINLVRDWGPGLSQEVRNRFDVVGFDPRGVGQSTPLICHDNLQALIGLEPNPKGPEQWTEIERQVKAFDDLCAQRGGDLLRNLGSLNVVRDMDRIRQALGDEKLTYFGYSYGTALGQLYADMFPDKVRAIAIDGALDMTISLDQLGLAQAEGFEGALAHWSADCKARQCVPSRYGEPAAAVKELLRRAGEKPIPADSDRDANAGETMTAITAALYTPAWWNSLGRAVTRGLEGDGTNLVRLVDDFFSRNQDGSYDNLTEMYNAVTCLDYASSRDPLHYRTLADQWEAKAPVFGRSLAASGIYCAYWKPEPVPLKAPQAKGSPPILVVGTTGDPATPYQWAVNVSRYLEPAVLLTFNGEGHTAYRTGNRCIDEAVNAYLLDLALPAPNTSCGDASKSTPLKISKAAPAMNGESKADG